MAITGAEAGDRRRLGLRHWHASSRRDFPWRRTRDPWQLLVAETLLRRTKADQVHRRISEVLAKYPEPRVMAATPLDEIREDLREFGLRWRADNLAECSQIIMSEFGGRVPSDAGHLLSLPGVGPYVASAVSAAAFGAEVSLVDANTVRVATRVAGVYRKGDIRRRHEVISAVDDLLGGVAVAADWWAVLDLAASVCVSGAPRCAGCPIQPECVTGQALVPPTSGISA